MANAEDVTIRDYQSTKETRKGRSGRGKTEVVSNEIQNFLLSNKKAGLRLSLDEVIDVDVEVVVKLDEVDGGLGLHLLDDQADALAPVLATVLHVLAHQAVHHLPRLGLLWGRLLCGPTQHTHHLQPLTITPPNNAMWHLG